MSKGGPVQLHSGELLIVTISTVLFTIPYIPFVEAVCTAPAFRVITLGNGHNNKNSSHENNA